eukprot:GILI01008508.1.p1 GENE.GILI01008508.1~~GILI01008508.1.p1  ORF type:complete len:311 (-),score=56.20 GILI01008508.1:37-921(-)
MTYTFNHSKLLSWTAIHERLNEIISSVPKDTLASDPPRLAIIVSCGSFNPITTAHINMLAAGKRYLDGRLSEEDLKIYDSPPPPPPQSTVTLGAFVSPVNDKYGKADLAPFKARRDVCELCLKDIPWVNLEEWEGLQDKYERTFTVLSHIRREVRAHYAATAGTDEDRTLANNIECYFLCGGDLFETFYRSGVWDLNLLEKIFREFKLLVVARVGSKDPLDTLAANVEPLTHPSTPEASLDLRLYRDRVHVLRIPANTTSSTRVRDGLRSGGAGLEEMVGAQAVAYLRDNKVYV